MTTIVYDHKRGQIACDSRLTKGDIVVRDDAKKYEKTTKGLLFIAGSISDFDVFVSVINEYHHGCCIGVEPEIDAEGLLVSQNNGSVYSVCVYGGVLNFSPCLFSDGAGCGVYWALSALDHGKTAKQAVQHAASRDVFTGGKVRVYDIKKGKFING